MNEITQIRVGKHMFGIIGLTTALVEAAEQFNHAPVDHIGKWLRKQLSQRNYIPAGSAEMYEKAFEREYRKFIGAPVDATDNEGLQIKVLGPGCPQCERLEQEVMAAMSETGIMAEVEHVRDLAQIVRFGVMGSPALVINGEVKVVGSVRCRPGKKSKPGLGKLPTGRSEQNKESHDMKHLEIEWRHLDKDGKTCDRCSDTGETVRAAYADLVKELEPKGWEVALKETLLTDQEIPESNRIYFNGIAIEKLLPETRKSENCCTSCGEILGAPTMCRTLERNGQIFEAIPAAMIVEAAHRFIEIQTK